MIKDCNVYNIEANFKNYLLNNQFSRNSINNYISDVRSFLTWLVNKLKSQNLEFDIQFLSKNTFDQYKSYLLQQNMPVKTINRQFSSLKTLIKFCIHQGWIDNNVNFSVPTVNFSRLSSIKYYFYSHKKSILFFIVGFISIVTLFALPGYLVIENSIGKTTLNPLHLESLKNLSTITQSNVASTSGDLLTIPIIDQHGNLNLSAPYPKITGREGTLAIEAPQLSFSAKEKGSIMLQVNQGSIQFIFEGITPPLPYDSAFYFASKDMMQGTLIYAQTGRQTPDINLVQLSSGSPAETKFKVDAEGNVYIKGDVILDGNLIVNPGSTIFGTVSSETATSSYSPEP